MTGEGPDVPLPSPSLGAPAADAVAWLDRVPSLAAFEAIARERMDGAAFDYVAGGSWDEVTLRENVEAFRRRRLVPRVLVDVRSIDLEGRILGVPVTLPLGIAPTAFQAYAHPDGEMATAAAASAAGILFCLSTLSSHALEDVARAADVAGHGPRWLQLYVHRDRAISRDLVARAEAAGYGAVVLTVDLPVAGYRERDLRNDLRYPSRFGNLAALDAAGRPLIEVIGGFNERGLTWDDVTWLRGLTELPIIIKGVLTPEDATRAALSGARGVVVSNHGGRQLDRAPASIDVLESVVSAAGSRLEVYLDGGVRRGLDVVTALALGARAVFIGRPAVYALAAGGTAGVAHALRLMARETELAMALLGVTSIRRIRRRHVVP